MCLSELDFAGNSHAGTENKVGESGESEYKGEIESLKVVVHD